MDSENWSISSTDPRMCNWAYNYLRNRFVQYSKLPKESEYEFCIRVIENQESDVNKYKLLMRMRNAWHQKQHRDTRKDEGKLSRSYSLNELSLKQLTYLSNKSKLPLNKTLEKIINQAYIKEHKKHKEQKYSSAIDELMKLNTSKAT